MARKGKVDKDAAADGGEMSGTTIETKSDGTVVLHRHVREWEPHASESLRQIEATIDSWGRSASSATTILARQERNLDHEFVEAQVDKITKKVKGTRKVEVTETVTEWVEGPMGSGPIAVEEEPAEAWSGNGATKEAKPKKEGKGLFGLFGKKGKDKAGKEPADKDYQPQCMALTEDGAQCRNSARGDSKYCSSHKGYQPPTTKGLAQRIEGDAWDPDDKLTDRDSVRSVDTRPKVRRAPDTRLRTRKATKKGRRKKR